MQWCRRPGPRRPCAISKPRPSPSSMLLAGTLTSCAHAHPYVLQDRRECTDEGQRKIMTLSRWHAFPSSSAAEAVICFPDTGRPIHRQTTLASAATRSRPRVTRHCMQVLTCNPSCLGPAPTTGSHSSCKRRSRYAQHVTLPHDLSCTVLHRNRLIREQEAPKEASQASISRGETHPSHLE